MSWIIEETDCCVKKGGLGAMGVGEMWLSKNGGICSTHGAVWRDGYLPSTFDYTFLVPKRLTSTMSRDSDWETDLNDFVDMVNKTNDKQRKWVDGKLEVVCPACKNIAEHKEFTTFDYWYCNTCKAEV